LKLKEGEPELPQADNIMLKGLQDGFDQDKKKDKEEHD